MPRGASRGNDRDRRERDYYDDASSVPSTVSRSKKKSSKSGKNKSSSSSSSGRQRGGNNSSNNSISVSTTTNNNNDDPDLIELEERLTHEVDDEFFQDPRKFHTLHRVIDVLGMQLTLNDNDNDNGNNGNGNNYDSKKKKNQPPRRSSNLNGKKETMRIDKNPAYRALASQRDVVEEAIEHLALIHCADLNGSVVQVGRVARQFHGAVTQVQSLRKQVKDIQETLGTGGGNIRSSVTFNEAGIAVNSSGKPIDGSSGAHKNKKDVEAARAAQSSAMSLRELWLKKLEAEAVLALLEKLDTIRAAPMRFDDLLRQHRIGAAVLTASNGLDTMFMSDVNQVQALHKIMQQLMIRKQKAEEVVWELLSDVLFLRTGNGTAQLVALGAEAGELLFHSNNNTEKGRQARRISANASLSGDNSANSIIQQESIDGNSNGNGNGNGNGKNNNPNNNNNNNNPNNKNANAGSNNSMAIDSNNSIVATASVVSGATSRQQSINNSNSSTNPLAAASYLWNLPPSGWDYIRRQQAGIINPFLSTKMRFALDPDDLQLESILRNIEVEQRERERGKLTDGVDEDFYDDEEEESTLGGATSMRHSTSTNSLSRTRDPQKKQQHEMGRNGAANEMNIGPSDEQGSSSSSFRPKAVIPSAMMDAEFDLEADERRSLEEQQYDSQGRRRQQALHMTKPTYLDHVLALRTLVECLVRLRRLDDVERILTDSLERELSQLVQREQARTFLWVEKSVNDRLRKGAGGRYAALLNKAGSGIDLRDFRLHLNHILSAFGNVQVRLIHLTQIIRHRLNNEKSNVSGYSANGSIALRNLLVNARSLMEKELKAFLNACLMKVRTEEDNEIGPSSSKGQSRHGASNNSSNKRRGGRESSGLFSLGIIDKGGPDNGQFNDGGNLMMASTTSSRRSSIQNYTTVKFVVDVLFAKTTQNGQPQIRHALFFRKALAKWQRDNNMLRKQLAMATGEDTSTNTYLFQREQSALDYLDNVIENALLPVLQKEAVDGTVHALERRDAFDPVLDRNVYARADSNEPQDVDMCKACTALFNSTGPIFLALHRLPKGGDMYLPLVAVLEHVILTFISRVKQQVSKICNDKTALQLLMDSTASSSTVTGSDGSQVKSRSQSFGQVMERRKAFAQLVLAYADGDLLDAVNDEKTGELTGVPSIPAPSGDTPRGTNLSNKIAGMEDLDFEGGVEREELNLSVELNFVRPYLEFAGMELAQIKVCPDEGLMKAACLAHSLLKLASLLDTRLKVRSRMGITSTKTLTNTRALREAIKTIKSNGLKMAKFCRADILLQGITRLCKVCNSSTIVARDAVRIPSSINDLGEYMTAASDNLREAAGNAVTAYAFSTLEQYIPLCIIQTVRVLAAGKGVVAKAPLTMNGIEALDRSGSVLYRDLKGATSFDNSFWDIELAAVSFERSASFIAMMELEMAELESYYQANRDDFTEEDFKLMFSMNGPRRKGDIIRYNMLVKKMNKI